MTLKFKSWFRTNIQMCRDKAVNGITTHALNNWISTVIVIHTNDKNNNITIRFYSKRPHAITKMNDNINMDSTITGSMNARS
jgi:hypothetical protein